MRGPIFKNDNFLDTGQIDMRKIFNFIICKFFATMDGLLRIYTFQKLKNTYT